MQGTPLNESNVAELQRRFEAFGVERSLASSPSKIQRDRRSAFALRACLLITPWVESIRKLIHHPCLYS